MEAKPVIWHQLVAGVAAAAVPLLVKVISDWHRVVLTRAGHGDIADDHRTASDVPETTPTTSPPKSETQPPPKQRTQPTTKPERPSPMTEHQDEQPYNAEDEEGDEEFGDSEAGPDPDTDIATQLRDAGTGATFPDDG
jgi:hypothetical protein